MATLTTKILNISSVLLLAAGSNLFAAPNEAAQIMSKAYQYLGSMDRYAFDAVVNDDLSKTGPIAGLYKHHFSVKVDRPGKFRIDISDDKKERNNYLNNGIYTVYDHGSGFYGQTKAADTVDETLDIMDTKYGIRSPISALLYSDMNKRTKLATGKYFGKRMLDGVECDYIAFKNKDRIIHVWVQSGDKPLVKSYKIVNTSKDGEPDIGGSIQWRNDIDVSDKDFVFVAPQGAEKISIKRVYD